MRRDTVDCCSCACRQEVDTNLAFLNRRLSRLLNILPDICDVVGVVGSRQHRLNEEFVSTFGVKRRVFFHCLEKHYR